MKKKIFYIGAVILLLSVIAAWLLFGPATAFSEKSKYLFVRSGENVQQQIETQIDTGNIVYFPFIFKLAATKTGVWNKLKPGRFEVKKGTSIFNMVRMLRNNIQSPVKLVINKLR